jgi:hypothetical protein
MTTSATVLTDGDYVSPNRLTSLREHIETARARYHYICIGPVILADNKEVETTPPLSVGIADPEFYRGFCENPTEGSLRKRTKEPDLETSESTSLFMYQAVMDGKSALGRLNFYAQAILGEDGKVQAYRLFFNETFLKGKSEVITTHDGTAAEVFSVLATEGSVP